MKKIILLILTLTLITTTVEARGNLDFEVLCYPNGRLDLKVTNTGNDPIRTSSIKTTFSYVGDISVENKVIKGSWSKENIVYNDKALFSTLEGYLRFTGQYLFTLEYEGCNQRKCTVTMDKKCIGSTKREVCEGKGHLEIESCKSDGKRFAAILTNITGYNEEINPSKIIYEFRGENFVFGTLVYNVPKDLMIINVGEDRFELSFPSDKEIKTAKIESHICGDMVFKECITTSSKLEEVKVPEIKQSTQGSTLNLDSSKPEIIAPTLVQVKENEQKKSKVPLILSIIVVIALALGGIYYHNKHKGLNTKKTTYCDNCGAEIKKGDSFCEKCGAKIK